MTILGVSRRLLSRGAGEQGSRGAGEQGEMRGRITKLMPNSPCPIPIVLLLPLPYSVALQLRSPVILSSLSRFLCANFFS
ncbi:hypothetical protein JYQ62_21255 [Nostoc sp. UHCC 0702]|nr:hypothetical protein JYQ62_21255 [Nostoc sp. UHCC 0702]